MTPVIPLALALALLAPRIAPSPTPDPRPTIPAARSYLPVALVPGRVTPAAPTQRPTVVPLPPKPTALIARPGTDAELKRCLQTAGTYCAPAPGEYRPCCPYRVAAGVTLDGQEAVTIRGEGLLLYQAHGATIRNIRIVDADGDAIGVNRSAGVTIDHVDLSGWGDGGIDIVRTPLGSSPHVIRDSVLHDATKGALLGHQWESVDDSARVVLERVTFRSVRVRTPKIHRAHVTMTDCRISGWFGPVADVQLGGSLVMIRTVMIAGQDSQRGHYTPTGGTVQEIGTVFVPYRLGVGME